MMTKSLIVALSEAREASPYAAVDYLKNFTKRLAHLGSEADGALELAYMRGFQTGYEQCLKDGNKRKKELALNPKRAERK